MSTASGIILNVEQGSDQWAYARCGKATASRSCDIIATSKKGEAAVRRDYRSEIVCEILTGHPYPQYVSKEMLWGKEHEQDARAAYELQRGVLVDTCGFVLHPTIERFGASPDGLVDDDGLIEIKCPTTTTHMSYLKAGVVPVEHMPQMLGEMACTGRDWCDFVSYDPRLPDYLQLFVRRFHRDDRLVRVLEEEIAHFNQEVDSELAALPQKPQGIVICMDAPVNDEMVF